MGSETPVAFVPLVQNSDSENLESLLFKWFDAEFAYRHFEETAKLGPNNRDTREVYKKHANDTRREMAAFLLKSKNDG